MMSGVKRECEGNDEKKKKKKKLQQFQFGNYSRYYGYRNQNYVFDPRLTHLQRNWFESKHVLDIGCNAGLITLTIAKEFCPSKIMGIDIDAKLIDLARKNVRQYENRQFVPRTVRLREKSCVIESRIHFPQNVSFEVCNYVFDDDEKLITVKTLYDTIVCLSVTKWIQLNWGDLGLKRFFKRIYAELKPGGILILEPQPMSSYKRKKCYTPETLRNFSEIKLKPQQFSDYLLSEEVGFKSCKVIDTPEHSSKGFQRQILMFEKAEETNEA
ncbi:7SK snRNA methylphosphate capping enzyme-like protein [Leptotrombidium deliense]|uniref:RNA methyltransferase n=1 Tax=Leptotrombidium deliense TaxID=299467 RepID=A0A443SPM0_9ACAR|nr:7SK snRNA methylphosphate capping enzyme-like protein [Leptotrombidium deliense]